MLIRFLKVLPFFLVPANSVSERTGQVTVDVVDYDAVWVPADHNGPIIAAPFDEPAFEE
jgi:hypothetical protein